MSIKSSRRKMVVDAFREAFDKIGGDRWTFIRTLPNWATVEWPRPYAVAMVVERAPFLEDSGELSIAIQAFHRHSRKSSEEFDDGVLDEMKRDCVAVVAMVKNMKDENGDPIVQHVAANRDDEGLFESHELSSLRVEGFIARFRIKH